MVDWVVVGRFGRTHGIKGFITIQSFTEPKENILRYPGWHVFLHKQWQPLKLLAVESYRQGLLAQVEGYYEREELAELTNLEIAVVSEALPALKAGEYYWRELIGMKVVNRQSLVLGTVIEILPTGANDVVVVKGEKRHLIPYLPEQFILKIDKKQNLIVVDWDRDF